jgi:type I restriction enzyme S subunit
VTREKLSEICELLTDGTHYTPPDTGAGIPFLTVKDVSERGLDFDGCARISAKEYEAAARQNSAPRTGDILFSKDGTVGKVHLVTETQPFAVLSSLAIIRPNSRVDPRYLAWFLRSPLALNSALERKTGSAIRRIVLRDLGNLLVTLPPLDEQRRIAAILDQADALRRKRRATIAISTGLRRKAFVTLFGDPIINPKNWPCKALAEVGTLDRGISKHRPRNDPLLLGGPYPLIQTGDIANSDGYIRSYSSTYSEAGLKQSRLWSAGTLCVTIAANIGKTGILEFDACFPDSVVGFTPGENVKTEYVQTWMSFLQKRLEKSAPQFAQKNINLAILRAIPIPLPPIDVQSRFAMLVTRLVQFRDQLVDHSDRLDSLFLSLQDLTLRAIK